MPYADSALTARQWATQRALALWVLFAGDIPASDLRLLAPAFQAIRVDRGRLALLETVDPFRRTVPRPAGKAHTERV
jgi:hypothetical protein